MAITKFIPKLWAARLLQAYNRKLVFGALVNRNYEGEIRKHGDTVHINSLSDIAVKEYTPNTEIDGPEQLNTEDQTLVIDHGTYYNFYVDDVDKVQAAGDLMTTAMTNAADRLAEDAENYIIGKVLAEGGIKLSGGEGRFAGTFFGVLIYFVINTIFTYLNGISVNWQSVIMGALVLISVGLQSEVFSGMKLKAKKK